jgi:hypothetical protein
MPTNDEIAYTDPAASYVLGQGFTAGSWYCQGPFSFWSGNVPLQQFLLCGWFKIFGFNQNTAHFANTVYVAMGLLLLFHTLRRSKIIPVTGWRLAFMVFLLGTGCPLAMSTSGRPDALCFLIATMAFWAFFELNLINRIGLMFFAGMLAPFASLSLAAAFAFAGAVVFLVWRREHLFTVLALAIGGFFGTALLIGLYASHGTLDIFLKAILPHTGANASSASFRSNWSWRAGALWHPTIYVLAGAGVVAVVSDWLQGRGELKKCRMLFVILMFVFPVYMVKVGVLHAAYRWLLIFPISIAVFVLLSRGSIQNRAMLVVMGVALATAFGTSGSYLRNLRWLAYNRELRVENKNGAAEFIRENLTSNDVAVVEQMFWYYAKNRTQATYSAWFPKKAAASDLEKISVLVLRDSKNPEQDAKVGLDAEEVISFSELSKRLASDWKPVAGPFKFRRQAASGHIENYYIYRRCSP